MWLLLQLCSGCSLLSVPEVSQQLRCHLWVRWLWESKAGLACASGFNLLAHRRQWWCLESRPGVPKHSKLNPQWGRGAGNSKGSKLFSMALPPLGWSMGKSTQASQKINSLFIIVPFHSRLFLCCIWVKSYTKSLPTDLFTACQMRRKNLLLQQCLKFESSDSNPSMQLLKQPLLRPGSLKALHF